MCHDHWRMFVLQEGRTVAMGYHVIGAMGLEN